MNPKTLAQTISNHQLEILIIRAKNGKLITLPNIKISQSTLDCTTSKGATLTYFLAHVDKPFPGKSEAIRLERISHILNTLAQNGVDLDKELQLTTAPNTIQSDDPKQKESSPKDQKKAKKDKPTSTHQANDVALPQSKDDPSTAPTTIFTTPQIAATSQKENEEMKQLITSLQAENERLKQENKALLEQYSTLQREFGITLASKIQQYQRELDQVKGQLAQKSDAPITMNGLHIGYIESQKGWFLYFPPNKKKWLGREYNLDHFKKVIAAFLETDVGRQAKTLRDQANKKSYGTEIPQPANSQIDGHQSENEVKLAPSAPNPSTPIAANDPTISTENH